MANIALIVNNILSDSGAEIGAANGVATLDSGGKIPVSQLPNSVMEFKGTWSAATNTPTLANGTGNAGDVYEVSAAGTVNFGAGGIAFALGDYVVYDGTSWQYSSGQKGTVTSLTFSAPLSGGTITTSGTVSIPAATSSVDGYLSATDWATFNGKQNALTNPVTGTGTANYLPKFTGASTLGNSNLQTDASGNLGLGVTPSAWMSSFTALQLQDANIFSYSSNAGLQFTTNAYYNSGFKYQRTAGATYYVMAPDSHQWHVAPSGTAGAAVTFAQAMTLFANGNLAIGTTSDAGYKLDVNGTLRAVSGASPSVFNTSTGQGIAIENSGSSNKRYRLNVDGTSFLITEAGVGTPLTIAAGGAATFSSSVTVNARTSNLALRMQYPDDPNYRLDINQIVTSGLVKHSFNVVNAGTSYNNNLVLDRGSVGIGTTSPTLNAKLTVMGNQTFGLPGTGANANGRYLSIEGNTDVDGEGSGRIFFTEHNGTSAAMDSYGMSLGYRGGGTSIVGASGNTWTGLSLIGNGEWGMWGHNGDDTGALIMYGDRAATFINLANNDLNNVNNAYFNGSATVGTFLRASAGAQSNPTGGASIAIDYQTTSDIQGRIRSRDWDGAAWKNLTIEANNVFVSAVGRFHVNNTNGTGIVNAYSNTSVGTYIGKSQNATANFVTTGVSYPRGLGFGAIVGAGNTTDIPVNNSAWNGGFGGNIGFWSDIHYGTEGGTNSIGYNTVIRGSGDSASFGFFADLSGATGGSRYGIYTKGEAKNYFSGNVLIGTTTDAGYKLDVNGTGRFNSTQVIGPDGTYGATYPMYSFTGTTNGSHRIFAGTADDMYFAAATSRGFEFRANGGTSATLKITSSGAATFSSTVEALRYQATSSSASLVGFGVGTGLGMYNAGTNILGFATASGQRMVIDASGYVGIGWSTPSWRLDVREIATGPIANFGYSQVGQSNRNGLIRLQSGTIPQSGGDLSGESGIIFAHSGGTGGVNFDANGGYIKSIRTSNHATTSDANSALTFATTAANTNAERMRITSGGSLLIGTTSQAYSPATQGYLLGVKSSVSQAIISVATSTQTLDSGGVLMGLDSTNSFLLCRENLPLTLHTNNAERVRITSGGNALIGTTTDGGYKLEVSGNFRAKVADSSLIASFSGAGAYALLYSGANAPDYQASDDGAVLNLGTRGGSPYKSLSAKGSAYFATSGGNVAIGTTTANGRLQVTGSHTSGYGMINMNSSDSCLISMDSSTSYDVRIRYKYQGTDIWFWGMTSNNVMRLTDSGNNDRFTVTTAGAGTFSSSVTATAFFESSDKTIKTLIQDNYQTKGIESVTAKLYIKNGKEELGYYAQDLQDILPSAVSKGTDGLLSLSYREVHTAKIARLEKRVEELEQLLNLN